VKQELPCGCNSKFHFVLSTRVRVRGHKTRRVACFNCKRRWTTVEIPHERLKAIVRAERVLVLLRRAIA
jgi:transcriptional regulator NrdR family protein